MSPMHHARNDHAFDVVEDFVEPFAFFRRLCWQRSANRAWFCVWRDPERFNFFPVIGDPIGELVKLFPKNLRRNVAELAW